MIRVFEMKSESKTVKPLNSMIQLHGSIESRRLQLVSFYVFYFQLLIAVVFRNSFLKFEKKISLFISNLI